DLTNEVYEMAAATVTGHMNDAWMKIDDADDPGFFIHFLDATRAKALEFARKNPAAAFAHLDLKTGLKILDCGCGTGDTLTIMAQLTSPGEAVGGELSTIMLQEAKHRASAAATPNLRFEQMSVQSIPYADRYFDRVMATQLLVHVPEPRQAFDEMCRVTAHDGLICLADMDWDTLVLGCSNKDSGRKFTRLFSDGIRNGLVVREYAGWLRSAGFSNLRIIPQPMIFDNWAFVRDWIVNPSVSHFVATGDMSVQERDDLVNDLAERDAHASFFAASTFYTIVAQRT
ncbi:MAG TPA: methyltransferase domain-containing protein, partial [Anaerolineae bacterium]